MPKRGRGSNAGLSIVLEWWTDSCSRFQDLTLRLTILYDSGLDESISNIHSLISFSTSHSLLPGYPIVLTPKFSTNILSHVSWKLELWSLQRWQMYWNSSANIRC
jgi:hypothetical protein